MQAIQFNPAIHPSFKQQFDKLTEAYIRGNVYRTNPCACFIGNLLNGRHEWRQNGVSAWGLSPEECMSAAIVIAQKSDTYIMEEVINTEANGLYTPEEILQLEGLFMTYSGGYHLPPREQVENEETLFAAFEKTLALLKQIHLSKGEIIDEVPAFTKRQLATV